MTHPHLTRRRHPGLGLAGDRGFSMMELMVGVSLTLIVLATTLGALSDGIQAGDTVRLVSQMQHNARSGLNLVTRDLMQTGQGIPQGGIPIPSGAGATAVTRPGPGTLTFPAGWVVLPAVVPGSAMGGVVHGRTTDILTVLYADAALALNTAPLTSVSPDGGTVVVDPGTPIDDPSNAIESGDLIMFSNPIGNAIQEVTKVENQTVTFGTGGVLNLNQPGVAAGSIIQIQDAPGSYPPTTATRLWLVTYYIDAMDASSPRLMKVVNGGSARPVALDVEDLQITYDLVDGYMNPSGVDEPVAPNSPAQIRKINVSLMTRSRDQYETTGEYAYQSLKTQVSLRSLSFIDRYQ